MMHPSSTASRPDPGVTLGSGLCKGPRWQYTQIWDDLHHTLTTTGLMDRSN